MFKRSMNLMLVFALLSTIACCAGAEEKNANTSFTKPDMYYTDSTYGRSFAKDPDVVHFGGRYLMYYTCITEGKPLALGIAESKDRTDWKKVGEVRPVDPCEEKGMAAPAAIVIDGKVHLFYQTYGNFPKDKICHAISEDGVNFTRNPSNPIFAPTGDWNCGRAIDAEVIPFGDSLFLYFASRDPSTKIQLLGVATAPLGSDYARDKWTQRCTEAILKPELDWEGKCIEAASLCRQGDTLYMFYAGSYNCDPQQIGLAKSTDGLNWERCSKLPLLPNGGPKEWNSSESGHPGIFRDDDGKCYLFFQGNHNDGKSWFLSRMDVAWEDDKPYLIRPRDGKEFHLR